RKFSQLVNMRVGDDHHVSGSVRVSVQDDKTLLAAIDDVGLGIVSAFDCVTEYAASHFLTGSDVGVAPRGPEVIHSQRQGSRWQAGSGTCGWFPNQLLGCLHRLPPPFMALTL